MADGPTVQLIIKKRDTEIAACESKANQDRASINGSLTYGLSAIDFGKGILTFGHHLKEVLLLPVQTTEQLCVHKARVKADADLSVRETTLEVAARGAEAKARATAMVLAATEEANQKYRELLKDRGRPLEPNLNLRGPQTLLAKK